MRESRGSKPRLKRENGKVWIDGIRNRQIGTGWDAQLRGMQILLEHRGEKVTLDDLMFHSGEAFNLCHGTHWELRTGMSAPTDILTNVARSHGYISRWIPPRWFWEINKMEMEKRKIESEAFIEQIRRHIDNGYPVLMGGARGECGAWRVIVGYDRIEQKVCHAGGRKGYDWTELYDAKVKELCFWDMQVRGAIKHDFYGGWLANTAFLLHERYRKSSERERAISSFRRALEMHETKSFNTSFYGGVTYYFGRGAYEQLAFDLHELDYPADAERAKKRLGDWYVMNNMNVQVGQIVRGRGIASRYCEKASRLFPTAKAYFQEAAREYRKEVEVAKKTFSSFLSDDVNASRLRDRWLSDADKRNRGVSAIYKMLEHESAAIDRIELALGQLEERQSPSSWKT
jgi:hypothetical protein